MMFGSSRSAKVSAKLARSATETGCTARAQAARPAFRWRLKRSRSSRTFLLTRIRLRDWVSRSNELPCDRYSDHMIAFRITAVYACDMDLGAPVLDVAPAVRGALLQALARLEQPVTRRQLAAAAGVSPGNASAVIEDLIRAGLVNEAVAGRSSMVLLNRNHLSVGPLLALAGLRGELIRRLRERLSQWPDLEGAWLFGSVARGDADGESDIDLLIIAHDLEAPDLHSLLSAPSSRRSLVDGKRPAARGAHARIVAQARALEEPARRADPARRHRAGR